MISNTDKKTGSPNLAFLCLCKIFIVSSVISVVIHCSTSLQKQRFSNLLLIFKLIELHVAFNVTDVCVSK